MFQKVGESVNSALGNETTEYHYTLVLDNKLWIFSRKYQGQPMHNWGHRVAYIGGYAAYFDLTSRNWSRKMEFSALAEDENMDELLFIVDGHIHLLLYNGFGGMKFISCFQWDSENGKWHAIHFEVEEGINFECEHPDEVCSLFVVDQENSRQRSVILASHFQNSVILHELHVGGEDAKLKKLSNLNIEQMWKPVMGASWENNVFLLFCALGCGYRFQPDVALQYNRNTGQTQLIEIKGEKPPFCFSGSRHTALLASGKWIHAAGSVAFRQNSRFTGEIWELDLNNLQTWKKLPVEIQGMDSEELCIAINEDRKLYVFDRSSDVMAAALT
ncbi:unnamed protein product [Gongylonema pulchrum]|uniref:Kelch repeat-containing protein n=1 Tax=Gongylonema pulchrum TaxID=637853 RepID=A0A183E1N7_9BILA|nr:unnamed protein product [Gongylonema pulchrum]